MSYTFGSRSAESYKQQLLKIQQEIGEIIESMEEREYTDDCDNELDHEHNTYKSSGYDNSIQLKRKRKHHSSRSPNAHQLDGNTEVVHQTE